MNKLILLTITLITSTLYSQKLKGFGGGGVYLNPAFEKSLFVNLNTGLEYKVNNLIKPEIEFNYYFGSLPDASIFNEANIQTSLLVRTTSAMGINFCPKINLGDYEDKVIFQIFTQFNIYNVTAKGSLFTLNSNQTNLIKTDSDEYKEIRYSFGIGIGMLFELNGNNSQSIALNLVYSNIEIGNAINKLKFNGVIETRQSLGISLKYYFSFKKNKNNIIN
ncbi:hypothetical protein [Flavobacterium sp.]|uniref:hypothetical protein n=1 Tax=Flavobacterium sp. TaxID=239 RepID=UPI003751EFCD